MIGAIISLRKVALYFTIFSAWVGVGATNHAQVSVKFFCTPVSYNSWSLLKLSSTTSLKRLCPEMFMRERLLILTKNILFFATVL